MIGKIRLAALASIAAATMAVPASAFAATASPASTTSSPATIVVAQGPGYIDTEAPANAPKPATSSNGLEAPLATTTESGTYNSTQTWSTFSTKNLLGSYVETNASTKTADAHKAWPWQPDYMTVNGTIYGYWYGSSPYDATNIYITPEANITATSAVVSVSLPGAIGVSTTSNTMYVTYNEVTNPNTWNASYQWGPGEVSSTGSINNVQANAEVTYQFGSASYSCNNTTVVNY